MNKTGLDGTRFAEARRAIVALAGEAEGLGRYGFLKGPVEDFRRVFAEKRQEERLHVAVCGAYSAGKSTLVRCLTGRTDIKVGKGVTTDATTEYDCGDWTIVDTPGIFADRPEHDEMSSRYMERADLLVYMIPSTGFSPEVEKNFKGTIMERHAKTTMLVMGRISDAEEDNFPAKRKEVADVLGGEEMMERYRFCMVDVEDYLSGDEELMADSGMDEFHERLEDFLSKNGAYGKCTALLNVLDGFIGGAKVICESQAERDSIARQRRQLVLDAMERYRRVFRDAKGRLLEFIAREETEMLALFPNQGEEFQAKAETLSYRLEKAADDPVFQEELRGLFDGLAEDLKDICEQSARLDHRFAVAFGNAVGGARGFDLSKWKEGAKQIGNLLATMSKETLVQIVHFFGGKFKPYGALKCLKFLKGLGAAIPIVADGLGMAADLHADHQVEEGRAEIRKNFDEIGQLVREFYDGFESTEPYRELKAEVDKLDEDERIRRRTNEEKREALDELEKLGDRALEWRRRVDVLRHA